MKILLVFSLLSIFLIAGCVDYFDQNIPQVDQGVYGFVYLRTGSFPDDSKNPISTNIFIREPVFEENNSMVGRLYLNNKTVLIKKSNSNEHGFYEIELPVGKYSMFVEDMFEKPAYIMKIINEDFNDTLEYCGGRDSIDGKSAVCYFEVKENELTRYDITINHALD